MSSSKKLVVCPFCRLSVDSWFGILRAHRIFPDGPSCRGSLYLVEPGSAPSLA